MLQTTTTDAAAGSQSNAMAPTPPPAVFSAADHRLTLAWAAAGGGRWEVDVVTLDNPEGDFGQHIFLHETAARKSWNWDRANQAPHTLTPTGGVTAHDDPDHDGQRRFPDLRAALLAIDPLSVGQVAAMDAATMAENQRA